MNPNDLIISFSIYTNGKLLFDVTRSKSPDSINCLHGLRALSVFWIIFGHRFNYQRYYPVTNGVAVFEQFRHIYSVIFTAFDMPVDTFLVMGAMLMTMSTIKAFEEKRFNVLRIVLHRYLRYTPVLAALILYIVSIFKFTLDGPVKWFIDDTINQCETNWWSTLLHIQNYINPLEQCLDHFWYLSADFQLVLLSPFLIYPAWKFGWKFLWILLLFAVSSSLYIFIMCFKHNLDIFGTTDFNKLLYRKIIYYPTHARLGPWMIGIILGFTMNSSKGKNIKTSKFVNSFSWILALSIIATVVLIRQPFWIEGTSLLSNAAFLSVHRLAWAIAISWMIFACEKLKTGGIIRWFLSLPQWQPIAKMSLSMYLVHVIYQLTTLVNQKQPVTFEILSMVVDEVKVKRKNF